jgi:hypothetical protein
VLLTYQAALSPSDKGGRFSEKFRSELDAYFALKYVRFITDSVLETFQKQNEIMRQLAREHKVTLIDVENALPRTDRFFYSCEAEEKELPGRGEATLTRGLIEPIRIHIARPLRRRSVRRPSKFYRNQLAKNP